MAGWMDGWTDKPTSMSVSTMKRCPERESQIVNKRQSTGASNITAFSDKTLWGCFLPTDKRGGSDELHHQIDGDSSKNHHDDHHGDPHA